MGENYINHLQIIIVPENQSYTLPSTQAEYEGKIIFLEGSHTIFVNGIKYVASSEAEYAQLSTDVTTAITALTNNHMLTNPTTTNGVTTYTINDKIGDLTISSLTGSPFASVTELVTALKSYADSTFIKSISSNNTSLTRDANGNVNITGQNIEVGGSGTHSSSKVGAAIEDIYTNIGATGQNAALKLYKVVPSGTSGEQTVDGANVLLLDGSSGKEKNITADGSEYKLYQGDTVVAKFNIEKDSFVKSGSVVQGTLNVNTNTFTPGNGSSDTYYIHLVIGTTNDDETDLYIPATSLIDVYTGITDNNETGVSISVNSSNQIGASLHIANATETQTAAANNGQLALSVTTTNGKVTAISGSIAANTYDEYGAAADVLGTSSDASTANTVYGAKAAATAAATEAAKHTSVTENSNYLNITTTTNGAGGIEYQISTTQDLTNAMATAASNAANQVVSWEVIGASSGS